MVCLQPEVNIFIEKGKIIRNLRETRQFPFKIVTLMLCGLFHILENQFPL